MVATSEPMYPTPEVPTEKGYDWHSGTDVPGEHANETPTAVPTQEGLARETAVEDDEDDD